MIRDHQKNHPSFVPFPSFPPQPSGGSGRDGSPGPAGSPGPIGSPGAVGSPAPFNFTGGAPALPCADSICGDVDDLKDRVQRLESPSAPLSADQLRSMTVSLQEAPKPYEEPPRGLRPGGHGEATFMGTNYKGTFFTYNGSYFMAVPYHALVTDQEQIRHKYEFPVQNAEVTAYLDGGILAMFSGLNETFTRLADTWGFSFAQPLVSGSVAEYVANKEFDSMVHFGLITSNRDFYIARFTNPEEVEVISVIPSPFAEDRSWSDVKTYQVTTVHIQNVTAPVENKQIIEWSSGKIGRVLRSVPYPGAPEDSSQRVLHLETSDLMAGGETARGQTFFVHHVVNRFAAVYVTQEGPGALQVVNMSHVYFNGYPELVQTYYTSPVDGLPNVSFGVDWTLPFTGAHNLYVDNTDAKLWVPGWNDGSGVPVFTLSPDPYTLQLYAVVQTPFNSRQGNASYTHDMQTFWYTREEQEVILRMPEHARNDYLGLAVFCDETQYTLANITDLPAGAVDLGALGRVMAIRQARAGNGYLHQVSWSPDGRFIFMSDEDQPQGRRFDGRIPVFRTIWRNQTLDMVEDFPIKSSWPINVHNIYTSSAVRIRPLYLDQCGQVDDPPPLVRRHSDHELPSPIPFSPACDYPPPTNIVSPDDTEFYVYATLYAGGLEVFRVRYNPKVDIDSNAAWTGALQWESIAKVSATKWYTERFGAEWSNYPRFCSWETPAYECIFGANGVSSYRIGRLVPGLGELMDARQPWRDATRSDFILLNSPPIGRVKDSKAGVLKNPVSPEGQDGDEAVDILFPGGTRTFTYEDANLNYRTAPGALIGIDAVLDIAIYQMFFTFPPIAPELAPFDSDISDLYATLSGRIVHVKDARVQSDYTYTDLGFDLGGAQSNTTWSHAFWHDRRSEIVVGGIPAQRGDSGTGFVDAEGRLVGVLRDSRQGTFGLVDMRNFAFHLSGEVPGLETRFTGFWSLWDARMQNINTDPDDKIMVLAINERTNRAYQCVSSSGSPYYFATVEGAGDTIDLESGRPQVLDSVPGSIQRLFVTMNGQTYSTAVAAVVPADRVFTGGDGFRCGGCRLPVTGNVGNLELYEELHGVFAGGGPKILFLGLAPSQIIDGQLRTMIYFELIPQGNEIESGPQFGGPYLDSPLSGGQVHPPQGGNVLTGKESNTVLTVVAGYSQPGIPCPYWTTSFLAIPSQTVQTARVFGFWPLRNPPIDTGDMLRRSEGQNVFIANYTLPFRWIGKSSNPFLTTGIIGVQIESDTDKYVETYSPMEHLEKQFAPANRIGDGYILAISYNGHTWPVDSDTIFGVIARIPVGEPYRVRFFSTETNTQSWLDRKLFSKLLGNQMQLD